MSSNQRITVHTFRAIAPVPEAAIQDAAAQLQEWYSRQDALWTMDGASLFQFGMWLFMMPNGEFQYVITALDTRPVEYQG